MSFLLTILITAFVCFLIIWFYIRHPSHIKVNCWFCNKDTVVPYGNKNCWDCPHCQQYNGFQEDGDYNKPIPAQFEETLNHNVVAEYHQQCPSNDTQRNQLCNHCNRNQLLKVKQLAAFVPHNEATYDAEVEMYQHHLEQIYRLCEHCEMAVQAELQQQNRQIKSHLLGTRLKESSLKNDPANSFNLVMSSPWCVTLLRLIAVCCSLICCLGNVMNHYGNLDIVLASWGELFQILAIDDHIWLSICSGMLASITAILLNGKTRLSGGDTLCTFLWLLLLCQHSNTLPFGFEWLPWRSHLVMISEIGVSALCVYFCVHCLLHRRVRKTAKALKKRLSYENLSNMSSLSCDTSPASSFAEDQQSDNIFNSSSTLKNDIFGNQSTPSLKSFDSVKQNKMNDSLFESRSVISQRSSNRKTGFDNFSSLTSGFGTLTSQTSPPRKAGLDNTLDAMSLGPPRNQRRIDPGMWSTHTLQYNTRTSQYNTNPTENAYSAKQLTKLQRQKPLISPARLNISSFSSESRQVPTQDSRVSTSKQQFPSSAKEQTVCDDSSSNYSNESSVDSCDATSTGAQSSSCLLPSVLVISALLNCVFLGYLFYRPITEFFQSH